MTGNGGASYIGDPTISTLQKVDPNFRPTITVDIFYRRENFRIETPRCLPYPDRK